MAKQQFFRARTEGARTSDWRLYKLVRFHCPVLMATLVGKSTSDVIIAEWHAASGTSRLFGRTCCHFG